MSRLLEAVCNLQQLRLAERLAKEFDPDRYADGRTRCRSGESRRNVIAGNPVNEARMPLRSAWFMSPIITGRRF